MIKDLLPRTAYEREALLKAFSLFFLTMVIFLGVVSYMIYRSELFDLKSRLFLELKNYSYTFEGDKFEIEIVPKGKNSRLYELLEDEKGLYILVPVPVSQKDLIKIIYPSERHSEDVSAIRKNTIVFFFLSSSVAMLLSLIFALYSINPLRRALNMVEEVTRDIIHDINTPLMTLRVNLKILKSKYKDEEIVRAELALKQLQSLRENLRPLESKAKLKLEEIELKNIIVSEIEDFKNIYPEKKVYLQLENVKVKADRNAVRRIVSNLLDNAFKHSLRGSWVRVTLQQDVLLVENPAKPPGNLQKLFERYYKESQRGLGLGLSIVKKLCNELGWDVNAQFKNGVFSVKVTFR